MSTLSNEQKESLDTQAVNNFREYLQIPSVHPDIDYEPCVKFLRSQAKSLDLPLQIFHIQPTKPIVVLTWTGSEPNLPTILLNSHMDVVPVFEDKWTHKPFGAEVIDGKIFARGSQDMKCVGIQYLEAIRRLKLQGVSLKRTFHISFVPDEEIGGYEGMKKFVLTQDFKNLKVGFALDEGMASPDETFSLFYGERNIWQFIIHCPGDPGHGSLLLDNTAGEKVAYLLNKFYEFRRREKQKLIDNPSWTIGDVTTVNVTQLRGGVAHNVIPSSLSVYIDCRIPPTSVDIVQWEATINQWCKEAGSGVTIEYYAKDPQVLPTKLDSTNPFYAPFKKCTDSLGLSLKPQIFTGGTDSRYVRELDIPVIGFSPMNNTPILLHDNDEFLRVDVFLKGIEIYTAILTAVGNVDDVTG